MDPRGTHVLVDLYGCKKMPEDAVGFIRGAAEAAGLKILREVAHNFEGGGATALLLLETSHASVHTWPECNYVSFDLYSCKRKQNGVKC